MNYIRKIMKNWQLNLLIAAYITVSCGRYLTVRTVSNDEQGLFKDLLLISITAIIGEFIVVGVIYIYQCLVSPERIVSQSIKFMQFLLPAACDFTRTIIYVFSFAALSSALFECLHTVSLALALIGTLVMSKYVIASWNQSLALILALISLSCLVWLSYSGFIDQETNLVKISSITLALTIIIAILQAMESSIIHRAFLEDDQMSAFTV